MKFDSVFSALFEHFWLLCGVWVGGFGALDLRRRFKKHVASGEVSPEELRRLVIGWATVMGVTCLLFWMLQMAAGPAPSPFYVQWPSPFRQAATGLNVALWAALLVWVWLLGGDRYAVKWMALSAGPFGELLASTWAVRLLSVLVVLSGVIAVWRTFS